MQGMLTVKVTTRVYGLGMERIAPPNVVALPTPTTSARNLLAAHVRAEAAHMQRQQQPSVALHYMLADDLAKQPAPASERSAVDVQAETARAWQSLTDRRYLLVVDGNPVDELDAPLNLTPESRISVMRLVPMVTGQPERMPTRPQAVRAVASVGCMW